jgi:steroid delta-isomerase-like uncharacterized protein
MTRLREHAQQWASSITVDTQAVVDLFADDLVYDDRRDIDHVVDTATTKDQLRGRIAAFANRDAANGLGIHHFEVLDVIDTVGVDGRQAVAILWQWTGEHLENFRGVPTEGKILSTRGQTWHQFDADGKVDHESTFWNDVPVFQELGLPIFTPPYWEADFDLSALTRS